MWQGSLKKQLTTSRGLVPLNSPKIQILTAKISELKKTLFRDAVETVIEIGEYLTEAKSILSHGDRLKWLAENVHFGVRTAQRYMQLAEFARANATLVSHLKDGGTSKLYKIAALPQSQRKRLLSRKQFRIPDTEYRKTISEMSKIEFYKVVNFLISGKKEVDPDQQARSVRKLLRKTCSLLERLRKHAERISPEEKDLLTTEFKHLASQINNLKL